MAISIILHLCAHTMEEPSHFCTYHHLHSCLHLMKHSLEIIIYHKFQVKMSMKSQLGIEDSKFGGHKQKENKKTLKHSEGLQML